MFIIQTKAQAIYDASDCDSSVMHQVAEAAITTFLEAAAKQGWHMLPNEATEKMAIAGCNHENLGDRAGQYLAMCKAAPKFNWQTSNEM